MVQGAFAHLNNVFRLDVVPDHGFILVHICMRGHVYDVEKSPSSRLATDEVGDIFNVEQTALAPSLVPTSFRTTQVGRSCRSSSHHFGNPSLKNACMKGQPDVMKTHAAGMCFGLQWERFILDHDRLHGPSCEDIVCKAMGAGKFGNYSFL